MDRDEIAWRTATVARQTVDRARFALRRPRWSRRDLQTALARTPALDAARQAVSDGRWLDAHRALAAAIESRPARFPISSRDRAALVHGILAGYPNAHDEAKARADRLRRGVHDVLGYSSLCFNNDWHLDPVHGRRAPDGFWSTVPYLDPACGDHKVIWEPNRHQHWLALGRAFWLTGDETHRQTFIAELASWMTSNPPLAGINWASMLELAFRSISWTWAVHFFAGEVGRDSEPWLVDLFVGLDRQVTHIERNLSYYFSPNTHLLGEGLALYVVGSAFPELGRSETWRTTGRRILASELSRQIEPDGGHAERSTYYHRYALDFYLLALAVARATGDASATVFGSAVERLATSARALADDEGRLPHIGDDDGGRLFPITPRAPDDVRDSLAIAAAMLDRPDLQIGKRPEEVFWLAARWIDQSTRLSSRGSLAPASCALPATGYYISRSTDHHLVIDGGPHGFLNGGHAHADALALTLSTRVNGAANGEGFLPLLIDAGTGVYTADDAIRDRFRSTAAHNTVVVDGCSQSIPDGPFHWKTSAHSRVHRWQTADTFDYFDGSHDGYAPLDHRRRVFAAHGDLLVVADFVSGAGSHRVDVNWHVDPRWNSDVRGSVVTFAYGAQRVRLLVPRGAVSAFSGDHKTGLGWHSPVYGRIEPATTIRVRERGTVPMWIASVFDFNNGDPIVNIEWVPVWAEAGALAHSVCLKISRAASTSYFTAAEPAGARAAAYRIGEFETDARFFFCRVDSTGRGATVALVDGTFARANGRRQLESTARDYSPCAVSPGS